MSSNCSTLPVNLASRSLQPSEKSERYCRFRNSFRLLVAVRVSRWRGCSVLCYTQRVSTIRSEQAPGAGCQDAAETTGYVCDLCGKSCSGLPGGSGLFMWTRGSEVRLEEPPLCKSCAAKLTLRAYAIFEDDGGED